LRSLYNSDEADTLYTATEENVNYRLPDSYGIGVGLHSRRSIVAADLKFTNWSYGAFSNEEVTLTDTWRLSAGYYYKGNPEPASYLGSMSFRTGVYAQNHFLAPKGNTLNMWVFSMGAALPAFDNRSSINLTYGYDRLGTRDACLIKQQAHNFTIDVVIRDLWEIKRKFD
jgi:hypothetical protein